MDARAERAGKNEAVFREVNERISDLTRENAAEFLCECATKTCTETLQMTRAEYENVRSVPTDFAVLPGHEVPDLEEVVERNDAFLVVRKKAGAGGSRRRARPTQLVSRVRPPHQHLSGRLSRRPARAWSAGFARRPSSMATSPSTAVAFSTEARVSLT